MAISNYSELKTAIANWLDRSDLTSYLDDFIALAEARVSRDLRVSGMENRDSSTSTVAGTAYYDKPTSFLEAFNVQLNTSPVKSLRYVTPEQLDVEYLSSVRGEPAVYTFIGDQIQLSPTPDGVYTLEIGYYKKLTGLSSSNTTNWLITNAPDVYLYACLLEATPFVQNDERLQTWVAAYSRAIESLQQSDSKGQASGSALTMKPDTTTW